MKLPTKAIIAVAGTGTRFLPATKVVTKEMLPMVDKPIVQYSVEEVLAAGVKDIILVTREGVKMTRDHFKRSLKLEKQLANTGKKKQLKMIKDIADMANFIFTEQKLKMPYGTASPLLASLDKLKNEPFFYLFGDDMTLSEESVCKQLLDVYKKNPDVAAVLAVQNIDRKEAYRYGMVKLKAGTKNVYERIVEKPKLGDEPSTMASFGRFLFTPKIIPLVKKLKIGQGNELWLMDAINELSLTEKIVVHPIKGKWLTTGDPINYLRAMVEFVWQRDDLRKEFKKCIEEKLKK